MQTIREILQLDSRGVVSLTGGGGKTSLMFHLAALLACNGKKVLTTTTTRIFMPHPGQTPLVLIDADPWKILARAEAALKEENHLTAGSRALSGGKLQGHAPEDIEILANSGLFDWILVEADGSARRPLKAPAGHEPVIPRNTTVLIAVAGLDVLGHPLAEELVFRPFLVGERTGLDIGDSITEDTVAKLFLHPLGAFKGAPAGAARHIFLNKADDPLRRLRGEKIVNLLRRQSSSVAETLIIGQALDSIRIHACHGLAKTV